MVPINLKKITQRKRFQHGSRVDKLSEIAQSQPHATFSAFSHGLRHRYAYIMRTISDISHLLIPLDESINRFISTLLNGYNFNDNERQIFSLPVKLGGLGIIIPSKISDIEYQNSVNLTKSTSQKITRDTI